MYFNHLVSICTFTSIKVINQAKSYTLSNEMWENANRTPQRGGPQSRSGVVSCHGRLQIVDVFTVELGAPNKEHGAPPSPVGLTDG